MLAYGLQPDNNSNATNQDTQTVVTQPPVTQDTPTTNETPEPEVTPTKATLEITSDPEGATVKIDSFKLSDKTPISGTEVDPGEHEISISLEGFETVTETFYVDTGDEMSLNYPLVLKQQKETTYDGTTKTETNEVTEENPECNTNEEKKVTAAAVCNQTTGTTAMVKFTNILYKTFTGSCWKKAGPFNYQEVTITINGKETRCAVIPLE
jgi:hypothetical protein